MAEILKQQMPLIRIFPKIHSADISSIANQSKKQPSILPMARAQAVTLLSSRSSPKQTS